MKTLGEQPQSQDDTDPQKRGSKHSVARKIGAAVTAAALTVSLGAGARVGAEPNTINGTAEMSAEALNDPMIYFKSDERNKPITEAVNKYSDLILRDMSNHPERTKFVEDGPTEDNDDNKAGHGAIVDTIHADNGDTYTFILLASQHGALVDGGEVVMTRRTVEDGKPVETGVTFVQQSEGEEWSTQVGETRNQQFMGTTVAVNFSVAERPDQTGQTLEAADEKALMTAQQYITEAGVGGQL